MKNKEVTFTWPAIFYLPTQNAFPCPKMAIHQRSDGKAQLSQLKHHVYIRHTCMEIYKIPPSLSTRSCMVTRGVNFDCF